MQLSLNSVDKVKNFVNVISKFEDNIDLISGRCMVDAKSILGIFSLNLARPVRIEFNGSENQDSIKEMLCEFEAV
ncbi:HPr family phosphocarrier protein [Anaerobium acetethylicum]|uniref:PTS HPr component phosphorylation site n=1 Tax=Anaerobium acetethylicum TaxID=1619234 RepID=A0A1D3TY85_9FIRM|nr:HPr family phosphocarrier protein [Anaerobium acetethylicum]SCP99374.1 PTS HPr component phosphorylation site [Anaerobium acetethylicum]